MSKQQSIVGATIKVGREGGADLFKRSIASLTWFHERPAIISRAPTSCWVRDQGKERGKIGDEAPLNLGIRVDIEIVSRTRLP